MLEDPKCKEVLTGSHGALIKTTIQLDKKDSIETDPDIECLSLTNHSSALTDKLEIKYNDVDNLERAYFKIQYSEGSLCDETTNYRFRLLALCSLRDNN